MPEAGSLPLLPFIMPGLLHGMSNALFSIQSQAQVLSAGTGGNLEEITSGCTRANSSLELLRLLSDRFGEEGAERAGDLIEQLAEPIRIAVRERGLQFTVDPGAGSAGRLVPKRTFVRAAVRAAAELCSALPTGSRGAVCLTWSADDALTVEFASDREHLPFDIALEATCDRLVKRLERRGVDVAPVAGRVGVTLRFPPAAELG